MLVSILAPWKNMVNALTFVGKLKNIYIYYIYV